MARLPTVTRNAPAAPTFIEGEFRPPRLVFIRRGWPPPGAPRDAGDLAKKREIWSDLIAIGDPDETTADAAADDGPRRLART